MSEPYMSTLGKRHNSTTTMAPRLVVHSAPLPLRNAQTRSRSRTRHRHPLRSAYDKQVMVVAVMLLTAGLACLSAAYYILTGVLAFDSSSAPHPMIIAPSDAMSDLRLPSTVPQPASSRILSHSANASAEKYLAYLPHSGFHNQRIALENALVLARILNRTLLLPSVRLGDPLSYAPFDELYAMAGNTSKAGLEFCRDLGSYNGDIPLECEEYLSYTHLPWDWLVDVSGIRSNQRVLEGWDFTDAWLEDHLGISVGDIFYLKDTSRNEYSFQDFFSFDPPVRKFEQSVYIATLARQSERMILMGTLFGSSRLHFRSAVNYDMRKHVRERMAFTNPHLVHAADGIRSALGGSYLGVHLRIGDGIFEWNAPENVRLAWWKLLRLVLGFTDDDILALEQDIFPEEAEPEPPVINPDLPAMRTPHPPLPPFPLDATPSPEFSCRAAPHISSKLAPLNMPLFISTDARSPTFNPLLARFTRTFPCSFFLEDFPEQVASLGKLHSPIDGVPLGSFLLPFLDAMVVGQAWQVVGTEQSTFSAFVSDVLWRTYRGFDIVQRG